MVRRRRCALLAVAVLAAVLAPAGYAWAGPPPTASAAGTFTTTTPAPVLIGNGALNGVSCPTAGRCAAVGSFHGNAGVERPLAEVRVGGSGAWTARPLAWPPQSTAVSLTAVACPTTTLCVAVGSYRAGGVTLPLAERLDGADWTGAAWAISPVPTPPGGGSFRGISCPDATTCTAVGTQGSGPLAMSYDPRDGSWVQRDLPVLTDAVLSGVSCGSATSCMAVGEIGRHQLVLQLDGSGSTRLTPSDPGAQFALRAVSCPAADSCVAVGVGTGGGRLTYTTGWDGTAWRDLAFPAGRGQYWALSGVSCTAVDVCTVVGRTGAGADFDHGSWTVTQRYTGTGFVGTQTGVACVTTAACTAVGALPLPASYVGYPTVARARSYGPGGWQELRLPQVTGAAPADFAAVSCLSATNCYAVGSWNATRPLIEHWDGTSWTVRLTDLDLPGWTQVRLYSISCAAGGRCLAVGWGYPPSGATWRAVAVELNGGAWRMRPPADLGPGSDTILSAVDCPRVDWCVAVGSGAPRLSGFDLMAQVWDGSTWTVTDTPEVDAGSYLSTLQSVSCPAFGDCVATGQRVETFPPYDGVYSGKPVVTVLRGTAWVRVAATAVPGPLIGISCGAPGRCLAVGGQRAGTGHATAAAVYTAPPPALSVASPGRAGSLAGVDCTSATSCLAVGEGSAEYFPAVAQGLVLAWDGTAYRPEALPDAAGTSLNAVSCAASACMVVGQHPTDQAMPYAAVRT